MHKKGKIILIILLICTFLTGCKSFSDKIIGNSECQAPCWYGITPRQTNYEETINILNSLDFVNSKSIKNNIVSDFSKTINWLEIGIFPFVGGGSLYFKDNTISALDIYPSKIDKFVLSKAVELYGTPDKVLPVLTGSEIHQIYMIIIYDNGIYLITGSKSIEFSKKIGKYELTKDTQIDYILYNGPNEIENIQKLIINLPYEDINSRIIPWPGYTEIETTLITE